MISNQIVLLICVISGIIGIIIDFKYVRKTESTLNDLFGAMLAATFLMGVGYLYIILIHIFINTIGKTVIKKGDNK